ncbi:hypothetical protein GOP47_0003162 [Adiantum capillus-veneris]|uniref:Uncharacterized protein n=1 Tax=Adiantum capillus-veneris TaxID=13818 RepID=A0A9D4VC89_ADICA|nr:hypothetical protein GOP47_0003162 [Adiantum capillus-veneris]
MGFQENPPATTIMFSCCKQESHTTVQGFKNLAKRLQLNFNIMLIILVIRNKDDLSIHTLKKANVVVFGCPQDKFTPAELLSIKTFINEGGSILYLSKEGGDTKHGANGNDLLQGYGITIKGNCLINTVQKEYLHPKQVLVSDCILCDELRKFVNSEADAKLDSTKAPRLESDYQDLSSSCNEKFSVVYPYGATLALQKPAVAILSSGLMAHPVRQPIGALWQAGQKHGRVAVVGSVSMFEDPWIEKENNATLLDFLVSWLVAKLSIKTDRISMEDLECADLECVPDIGTLANRLRCCLQEADELPHDFTKLPDESLFSYHMDLVPEVVNLYKRFGVKPCPLTLIAPEFETPTPPLLPAVFPPFLREPPPPHLDLFDLDDCFASPLVHLARLTNKRKGADPEDLIYYIKESASVIGIKPETIGIQQDNDTDKAKAILSYVMEKIVDMKKIKDENSLALTSHVL